jgi:hypothetical protein
MVATYAVPVNAQIAPDLYTTPPAAPVQEADTYAYAKQIAVAIWEKHYKTIAPKWEPCDELMAVLTQIDNMVAALTTPPTQPAPVPVEWMEMVAVNLLREGVNKHKARELAEHFYSFAPAAQPAPSQYGSPELQEMIVARALEKDRAAQPAVPLTNTEFCEQWFKQTGRIMGTDKQLLLQAKRVTEAAHGITKGQP